MGWEGLNKKVLEAHYCIRLEYNHTKMSNREKPVVCLTRLSQYNLAKQKKDAPFDPQIVIHLMIHTDTHKQNHK